MDLEELKYPIGKFVLNGDPENYEIDSWIQNIENFPASLESLVLNLKSDQLNWRYRPEGWKIKQVIHHCADSHINALIRFKLALTEEDPTIRPYHEARWADLADSTRDDVMSSLLLLKSLHAKWTDLIKSFTEEQWQRTYYHPEHGRSIPLTEAVGTYAWHCRHHLAHVENAIRFEGKFND